MHSNYSKHFLTLLLTSTILYTSYAQTESLSLEECHRLARANYPAIKKMALIAKATEYDIQNANKRFLPQVNFSGQATYQSETVSFPKALGTGGNAGLLPEISKDQYKIQGEISQLLYEGGQTKNQKELIQLNAELQQQNLEANLYALKNRVNSIFFSILLMDAQLKQNELNRSSLQTQVKKTEAALANGVAFRSNLDELKAEVVTVEMQTLDYKTNRTAYLKMLSLFIGRALSETTQLQVPALEYTETAISRPELKGFDLQQKMYDVQEKQLRTDFLPQVSAFFQGAYGRPTLNIIENKFGPWYIAGLRFNWALGSLYSFSNKKNTFKLNRQSVEADKEVFLFNTNLDLTQQSEQVKKYTALLYRDNEAISLRSSVTKSAEAQLNNGVITTHEYIQKLNAENLTRQTKILHEIQLLQAKYNQKFISGN